MTMEQYLDPGQWLASGHGPRYLALRRRLETAITEGVLSPGDPLPAEREIARLTGTSRVTVRKAIEDLARSGRVVQRRGSGSFVGERMDELAAATIDPGPGPARARLASLGEELALRGAKPGIQVLEQETGRPTPKEMQELGLSPEDDVLRFVRLRLADGTPVGLERTILAAAILPKPKKAGAALYAALSQAGATPVRALQRVGAAALTKKDAKLLGAQKNAPALTLHRTSYLAGGRVAEITEGLYLAGSLDLVVELRASEAPA
jgi:GntR family transcriptional regulator